MRPFGKVPDDSSTQSAHGAGSGRWQTECRELGAKIGDARMVENALRELEEGGYIAPALEAVSVWQESKLRMERLKASAVSGISSFGAKSGTPDESRLGNSIASNFSTFGKPVLPVAGTGAGPGAMAVPLHMSQFRLVLRRDAPL